MPGSSVFVWHQPHSKQVHAGKSHDQNIEISWWWEKYFPLLKKYSTDERTYVKKAVSWTLREIGKCRSEKLRLKTIKLGQEIKKLDTPAARWIASDVIRELIKKEGRCRFNKK